MALVSLKYLDKEIIVNDELDEKETGILIDDEEDKTEPIKVISNSDLLEDTSIDLFGDSND